MRPYLKYQKRRHIVNIGLNHNTFIQFGLNTIYVHSVEQAIYFPLKAACPEDIPLFVPCLIEIKYFLR